MSGSIKDLNEAVMSGWNIESVIETYESGSGNVDVDAEIKREDASVRGLNLLQDIVDKIDKEPDHKQFKNYLLLNDQQFDDLGHGWIYAQQQMEPLLFQLQSTPGIMTKTSHFLRIIKGRAKILRGQIKAHREAERHQHKIRNGRANDRVLELLDCKWINIDGNYVRGDIKPTRLNLETILREDPRFRGRFRYSLFDGRNHYLNKKNDLVEIDDILEMKLSSWVSQVYGLELSSDTHIGKIMSLIASENEFHPVQTYLKKLNWDGEHRMKNLFTEYMKSSDHSEENYIGTADRHPDYSVFGISDRASIPQIYGIRWMMAAVMRAMYPGVKTDNLLCIIGDQGIGKSTAVKELCYDESWFSDTPFDLTKKDSYMQIQGKWLIELPECETLHRSGFNAAKSFLSSCSDRYRLPYRRHAVDVKRTSIMVATTNQTKLGFLNDVSGHRRYWVCRVDDCDFNKIREDRDQLWAEAFYYAIICPENHWLSPMEEKVRQDLNDKYREIDSWEEEICTWIAEYIKEQLDKRVKFHNDKGPPFTIKTVLKEALGIIGKDQRKYDIDRAGKVLTRIGAERYGRKKVGRAYSRLWYIPGDVYKKVCDNYFEWEKLGDCLINTENGEIISKEVLDFIGFEDI